MSVRSMNIQEQNSFDARTSSGVNSSRDKIGVTSSSRIIEKGKPKTNKTEASVINVPGAAGTNDENDEPADAVKLEEQLTHEKLIRLQSIFEEADDDDDPGLDMDEFRVAMRRAMGNHLSDEELDHIFMKVDSNCDGTVDWDEYLSYMLLECREKDKMADVMAEKPLPRHPLKISMARYMRTHDCVNKICYVPCMTKTSENINYYRITDIDNGRYVTVSREGVINIFNIRMQHLKLYKVESESKHKFIGTLVTDTVVLPNMNLIAITTSGCNITFYDLSANKGAKEFERRLVISDLEICATCLYYWTDRYDSTYNILLWGDVRGNVGAIILTDAVLFNPQLYGHKTKVPFTEILKGKIPGAKGYKLPGIHGDSVKQIRYISQLNGFLSACRDRCTGLYLGDIEQRQHGDHFKVQGGVFTFDYCRRNNVIVTGGKDGIVRVWNPYVKKKPVMTLHGHNAPILFIILNSKHEHIISISELKEIRIYDLNTQSCVQSIFSKWIPLESRSIASAMFNLHRQALILANNSLVVFEHKPGQKKGNNLLSHTKPVTCVLYNSLFHQIVSGSADSLVCVWNAKTGERIIQFTAHINEKADSMDKEITTMSFDPTNRRLIVATRDGSINIWNFNNGGCLRHVESSGHDEVTQILWSGQRIFTTGWSQRIIVYIDSKTDEENAVVTKWDKEHKDDVLALAVCKPSIIASGAYDGEIIIWSLETGHVTMQFNASKGTKPFTNRFGVEVQLGQTSSTGSLQSSTTISQSTSESSRQADTEDEADQVIRRLSILPGFKVKQVKSPRGYRRFLSPKKDFTDAEDMENMTNIRNRRRVGITEDIAPNTMNEKDSVEALLFLKKRTNDKGIGTLVSAGTKGWVRFWSIHHDGGLVGQFNAAHDKGSAILAIATNPDEKYLITGDSQGYIKVWDIEKYCASREENVSKVRRKSDKRKNGATIASQEDEVENVDPKLMKKFPFLRIDRILRVRAASQSKHDPPPEETTAHTTLKTPPLLNSFRAHLEAITTMTYVPEYEYILTGSVDMSVRCNTLSGKFIGICGQSPKWNDDPKIRKTSVVEKKNVGTTFDVPQYGQQQVPISQIFSRSISSLPLPADVRKVASATTLKVYYGGIRPMKNLARNLVMFWIPKLKKASMAVPKTAKGKKTKKEDETLLQNEVTDLEIEAQDATLPDLDTNKQYKQIAFFKDKPTKCRQIIKLPKITMIHNQVRVYSSMPCMELEPIQVIDPPPSILEIRARAKNMITGGQKGRGKNRIRRASRFKMGTIDYSSLHRKSENNMQAHRVHDKNRTVRLSPLTTTHE